MCVCKYLLASTYICSYVYKRECHLFANTAICVCYIPPVFVLTFNIHRQIITTILIQNNIDF